jgi:hypothetical protein
MQPLYKAIADAPSSVPLPLRHHLMHQQPPALDPDGGADVYGNGDSDDNDISLIRSLACIPALVEDHQADMFRFTLTRDRYAVATFAGPDRPGATQVNIMQLVPHSKPVQVGHAVVPRPRIEQLAVDSRLLAACIEDSDVLLFRYPDDLPRAAADCVGANRRKRPKLESCGGEGMKDKNPGDTTLELVMIEQPLRIAASFYSPPQPRIFMDEWSMYYLADFRRPEDDVVLQFSVDALLRGAHAAHQPSAPQSSSSSSSSSPSPSSSLLFLQCSASASAWASSGSPIEAGTKRKRTGAATTDGVGDVDVGSEALATLAGPAAPLGEAEAEDWRRALVARLPLHTWASPDPCGGSNERSSMLLFGEEVVLHVGHTCIVTRDNNNDTRYRILHFG